MFSCAPYIPDNSSEIPLSNFLVHGFIIKSMIHQITVILKGTCFSVFVKLWELAKITSLSFAGFGVVFKAQKGAHTEVCNPFGNAEDSGKGKIDREVIIASFLM